MSPRQRNRRRERRRVIRIDRVDVYVQGCVVSALAVPAFKGRRYQERWLARAQNVDTRTFPPIVGVMEERWFVRLASGLDSCTERTP